MALISSSVLLGIADRLAAQYKLVKDAYDALNATGGGLYWSRVLATDDPDVLIPLLGPYQSIDENLVVSTVMNYSPLRGIVYNMENHFERNSDGSPLQVGGWDGYLQTSNKRVSYWFNLVFYAAKKRYLLANNVFSEGDDLFGTVEINAGPVVAYTDGINYGNGAITNYANGSLYAATQLRVVVVTKGATDLDLRLSVKDVNNDLTTIDVTVPGGAEPGDVVNIGTSSDRFLDVTNVIYVPAGDQGDVGDEITIRNLKERTIAL